jgi:cytochrome c-type biogenesis protein CcmH/NrfF
LAENWVGLKAVLWAVPMVVWMVGKWVELWDERKADWTAPRMVD